ncbi:beta-propeller fold lactonase family protein [Cupriavidus basilensis]
MRPGPWRLLPVIGDGALAAPASVLALPGQPGPHRVEQQGSHPHQALRLRGTNRFVFPDKGAGCVRMADFDSGRALATADTVRATAREGAGPRHAVLHPDGSSTVCGQRTGLDADHAMH